MFLNTKLRAGLIGLIIAGVLSTAMVLAGGAPKLVGAFFVKGKVGLKWQKAAGASEYNVYRKGSTGDWEKITTTSKTGFFDTSFSDGETYSYRIGIAGDDGELFSNEKTVTIPASEKGDFLPPTWSGLRLDQDKIYLNWDPVPTAFAYNIYRSATSGSGYEVVGNSQTSRYADKDGLIKGETYYYVVTALNQDFEETEYSEERSLKFGISLAEQEELLKTEHKIELEPVSLQLLFNMTTAGSEGDLNQPADVFVNSLGDIYVTDALNQRICVYAPDGSFKFAFGEKTHDDELDHPSPSSFSLPFTLFIDRQDQVYVTDIKNHDIQVFKADGTFIRRITVNTGDGKEELRANGIYVLDDGKMVLTDTGNHRVLLVSADGKILMSAGTQGMGKDQLLYPDEVTVTKDNIICVVDVINCRIQQINMDGEFVHTFGQVGQSAGTFARPKAITIDDTGNIWVSDGMSSMIQKFTPDGTVKSAIGTLEDSYKFMTPRGLFIRDGRLYVVNRVPHRVEVYKIG